MVDETRVGLAAGQCHLQRVNDEIGAHVLGHRPADYPPREGVLDGGEIDPALPAPQVGDVGDPEHVGGGRAEVAAHQVVGDSHPRHPDRRVTAPFRHQDADPCLSHQPLHPLSRDPGPVRHAQLGVDARRAVDPACLPVDLTNALG